MKRITLRVAVTIFTFLLGIGIVSLCLAKFPRRCGDAYVPAEAFNRRESEGIAEYYSSMQEWPFSCLDEEVETYRLLFIPSFETPASIRVWQEGGRKFIELRQLASARRPRGGAQEMQKTITRPLSEEEWGHFVGLLEKSGFWAMPTREGDIGLDGASFLLEGQKDGRYHVVCRWSPTDGNFLDACGYLLEISGRGAKK
jgi:hypothetical protein